MTSFQCDNVSDASLPEKSCNCLSKADLYQILSKHVFFSNNIYIISKKQYCSLLNNNISLESHVFIVGGRTIWTG